MIKKRLNEENIDIRDCWPFNYLSNPDIFKYSNINWGKRSDGTPWWRSVDFNGIYLSGTFVCKIDRSKLTYSIDVRNLNILTSGDDWDYSGFRSRNQKLFKEELNALRIIVTGKL